MVKGHIVPLQSHNLFKAVCEEKKDRYAFIRMLEAYIPTFLHIWAHL